MLNISKTVDRRGKRTKIWGSGYYSAYMQGTFDARFLKCIQGNSLHFAKFPIPRILKHYSFNGFYQISTTLHTKYHNQGLIQAISFLAICQQLKLLWHLEIFLNTGPCGAGISKRYSSQSFLLMSAKLYEDIWLPWQNMGYYYSSQSVKF